MSWRVACEGTRDEVALQIEEQFAECMRGAGIESEDAAAAKARVLALVDALDLAPDKYGTDWSGVSVTAHGSHERNDAGIVSAAFSVHVGRVAIPADPARHDNSHIQSGEPKTT
jgi:hypothetical protein